MACTHSAIDWRDCEKHRDQECYVAVCAKCSNEEYDCEDAYYKGDNLMVSKNVYGAWVITFISDEGDYVKHTYYDYTKGQACRLFREKLAEMGY